FRLIARGDADIVLSGGADSRIDPLLILAYTALGALSRSDRPPHEVSRPFDGKRDGFVLGEGAGVLLLEELEHAKRRGATIYAEVVGHLIGAAGAVEAIALALTLHDKALPPTINHTQPDPVCDLDYVPNSAREMPVKVGVSTSFGFGGQNAALVMSGFAG